jgi:hypothetical protein
MLTVDCDAFRKALAVPSAVWPSFDPIRNENNQEYPIDYSFLPRILPYRMDRVPPSRTTRLGERDNQSRGTTEEEILFLIQAGTLLHATDSCPRDPGVELCSLARAGLPVTTLTTDNTDAYFRTSPPSRVRYSRFPTVAFLPFSVSRVPGQILCDSDRPFCLHIWARSADSVRGLRSFSEMISSPRLTSPMVVGVQKPSMLHLGTAVIYALHSSQVLFTSR